MPAIVEIAYQPDYRGVFVRMNGEMIAQFTGGGPEMDWAMFRRWRRDQDFDVTEGESVSGFLEEVPGWAMILRDDRARLIVPDTPSRFGPFPKNPN